MANWPENVKVIAVITWDDSHGVGGWQSSREWKEDFEEFDTTCISVGYVAHEDDRRIWLVQSLAANGNMADAICIPRHAILGRDDIIVADLKPKRRRRP